MKFGFKENRVGDLVYLTVPAFEETGLLKHAFTTRHGGVSQGVFTSMNMSLTRGEDPDIVIENYRRICDAISVDYQNLVLSKQDHTDTVQIVTKEDAGRGITKEPFDEPVDGFICDIRELPTATVYADCVPLMMLDRVKGVYASVHSGWKGTIKRIGEKAIRKMVEAYGCEPEDILLAIGPSIRKCHFEVEDDVAADFYRAFGDGYVDRKIGDKTYIDLVRINADMAKALGVPDENITVADVCTCCDPDNYYSHRMHGGERGALCAIMELTNRIR